MKQHSANVGSPLDHVPELESLREVSNAHVGTATVGVVYDNATLLYDLQQCCRQSLGDKRFAYQYLSC